jgi:PhnB protein
MLIPHLHFCGECAEAIALYEEAFNTKIDNIDYYVDKSINHASMKIHGQTVFLNDNDFFANKEKSSNFPVHLIIQFQTAEKLLSCYNILKNDSETNHPFVKTPYSELVGNFADKFGMWWGFMVE